MTRRPISLKSRRQTLRLLGGAGAAALLIQRAELPSIAEAASASCSINTPQVTEGPYWVDEKLFRSDIRSDPATGVARTGVPINLAITLINSSQSCTPLTGAYVDIWHCDAKGIYSDEPTYNPGGGTGTVNTTGQKFLRGYQISDANGRVQFTTIYPGWYSGRTIHIHVRIRTYNGNTTLTNFVTQIFFDETVNNTVLADSAYSRTTARDTTNARDMVYNVANNTMMLATVTQSGSAYSAAITIDLAASTVTASKPVVAAIVNAASGANGAAPGSWISIFGTDLSPTTHTLDNSDITGGALPTTMQTAAVLIDGKQAYIDYVSPGQINALVPADSNPGTVPVVVTNSYGTSATFNTTMTAVQPGLFTQNGYALAVRPSDGTILNGTGAAANAGDILELYGTGFGPATGSPAPGTVFSGAYATVNTVSVKIGGVAASVLYAGLVGPGLYQINVVMPGGLTAGDNAVVATLAGVNSASAKLKVG